MSVGTVRRDECGALTSVLASGENANIPPAQSRRSGTDSSRSTSEQLSPKFMRQRALLLLLLPALISASVLSSIKKARQAKGRAPDGDAAELNGDASNHEVPEATVPMMQLRSGLSRQVQEALEAQGASITIMVVGETGSGKTSLLSNLFHRKLDWPVGTRTEAIKELTVSFQLQGEGTETSVPFEARLVDSPGWGDLMSLERSFGLVTRTLDAKYRKTLRAETRLDRGSTRSPTSVPFEGGQHVDVVLYCFNPHRCKGVDMAA